MTTTPDRIQLARRRFERTLIGRMDRRRLLTLAGAGIPGIASGDPAPDGGVL